MGWQMADNYAYDLILLDIVLPKLDGVNLCKQLRSKGCQTPILLLTGQGDSQQKAIALNAGADDYVVKPFDAEELIARVQALLRRGGPTTQPILTWGQLALDPSHRSVTYGSQALTLTPKEYAILELFLRNPQRILSARAIVDHAWTASEFPGDESVRVHIKTLRSKLIAAGAPKDFIKTKHREGYHLNSLYADASSPPIVTSEERSQVAELQGMHEELKRMLGDLRGQYAHLQQKHQKLKSAYTTLEQKYQKLQATCRQLEQQLVSPRLAMRGRDHPD